MDFSQLLLGLGINLTSDAIVEFIKNLLESNPGINQSALKQKLSTFINIQETDIKAESIINFLANSGVITIEGSRVYSGQAITMYAGKEAQVSFGNDSVSETPKTRIEAGSGARIDMQGGSGIRQNEDGSISFFTTADK